jgi:hypothetical protein
VRFELTGAAERTEFWVFDVDERLEAALGALWWERVGDGWRSRSWGGAFVNARVDWVGGVTAEVDLPDVTDFGPAAASRLETVRWREWQVRVPPLDLQRAVCERRGLAARVAIIDALAGAT